jgi:hypothetical protein
MTAHTHDHCTRPTAGNMCDGGRLRGSCEYEDCTSPDCEDLGHCECLCHSGKTCGCGRHSWPRMEAGAK